METDAVVLGEFIHARIGRAREHIDALRQDVASLSATDRVRIVPQLNEARTEASVTLFYRRPHPNRRWGCIIGDVAHSLRASLDNCVYAIATTAEGTIPSDFRTLGFPIADSPADWTKVKRSIRSLPPVAQSVIHDLQPYRGGSVHRSLLGHLNNADKHRGTPLAVGELTGAEVVYNKPPQGRPPRLQPLRGPALGAGPLDVLQFSEPRLSDPDITITLSNALQLATPDGWRPALPRREAMTDEVEAIVDRLSGFIA